MPFFTDNLRVLYNKTSFGDKVEVSKFISGTNTHFKFDKYIVSKTERGFIGEDGVIYTKEDIEKGNCLNIICPGDITAYTERLFALLNTMIDKCSNCFKENYFNNSGSINLYIHHANNGNPDSISISISLNSEDNGTKTFK